MIGRYEDSLWINKRKINDIRETDHWYVHISHSKRNIIVS